MGRIRFEPVSPIDMGLLGEYKAKNRNSGHPCIKHGVVGEASHHVAVVGGSPNVIDHLDELRELDGDILAINGTWEFLKSHGINSILYSIDPIFTAPDGVGHAVFGDGVRPDVVDSIDGAVEIVETGSDGIMNFSTSAATVPMFACWRGHKHVTFFGCDSSFTERSHAYDGFVAMPTRLIVTCGGREFETSPQMIMQAESIADMARKFPSYISVRGDGFLSALVEHGEYNVTHVTKDLHDTLERLAHEENLQQQA